MRLSGRVGGFPEPAPRLPERARPVWYEGYLLHVVSRDAQKVEPGRNPHLMRRFLHAMALNTAGVVERKTHYEAAGVSRVTADAYEHLLQDLFLVQAVPAWYTNRLKRLIRTPKRYLVDAGLAASACQIDQATVFHHPDLAGRLLDTFVAAQLRAELAVSTRRPRMHHLRTEGGRQEVDLVLELSGGQVIAIEIKASVPVDRKAARHLLWLRDRVGSAFLHGLVLHTGPGVFEMDDRITAAPVGVLWS